MPAGEVRPRGFRLDSYTPQRAHRPDTVRLWQRIETVEDPGWTARYHDPDPARRAFGGRAEIHLAGGGTVTGELAVADAHPLGAAPFARPDYIAKLAALSHGLVAETERQQFLPDGQVPRLGGSGVGRPGGSSVSW